MKCVGSGIARLAALLVVVAAGAHLLSATTLYVGNCRSGTFTTIQGAITAAPYGATVKVCPGTYNEQVSIGQSVILEGMTSHNDDQIFIVPPSGGLIINTDDISGRQVAAQVSVKNASGPVTISNVAVIGSGNGWSTCQPLIAGIFYQNSSGTINRVITTEQNTNHCGNGIWVEGGPSNPVVTVENSFVRSFDQYGINTETYNQPPTELTVKVTGNKLWGDAAARAGIYVDQGSTATVSANDVLGQASTFQYGILIWVNSTGSVSSNSVQNAIFGIGLHSDGVTVSSNKLLQVNTGIDLQTAVGTVKGNDIVGGVGIEFNCNSNPHVLSNSISGANVGIDKVPFGLVTPNSYFVVAQIVSNGC